MTIIRKIIFGGLYLFIGFCIETSVGQVTCKPYTLVQLPGAMPTNGIATPSTTRSGCESSCLNDTSCFGFALNGTSCSLNKQAVDALLYNATSVDYYNLIRSYTNCNSVNNCTYSWSGVKDLHGSGATNANINNLNDCIKFCQDNSSCAALDWNAQDKACWTYTIRPSALYYATPIYFFSKNCAIPTPQQPTTTLPSTPPLPSTTTSTSTKMPSSSSSSATTTTVTTKPASSSSSSSSSSSPVSPMTATNKTTVVSTTPTTAPTTVSLCNGVKCGMGEECGMNKTCVCSSRCDKSFSPVCGSDNRTYDNECVLNVTSCTANKTIHFVRKGRCDDLELDNEFGYDGSDGEFASNPISIRPAYIVLAGIGGGCLLLVITAVIILCQYPLRGAETYSSSGTLVNGRNEYASQDIKMDPVDGGEGGEGGEGGGGEENVEFNPYYNRSEMGAPDFTKEENIM